MPAFRTRRRFTTLALLAGALAVAIGCNKKDEPPKVEGTPPPTPPEPKKDPPKQPTPPADLKDAKPDVTYTAKAVLAEQKKDQHFPRFQHPGKVVEVTGVVEGYGRGESAGVLLDTGSDRFDQVLCLMADKHPWKQVLPTQEVVLRARVPLPTDPPANLVWQLIEVKGPTPPALTAEEFTREEAANAAEFAKKYDRKYLIVTGTIARVGKLEANGHFLRVWLQGVEKKQMLCIVRGPESPVNYLSPTQRDRLKAGQRVKLLGRYANDQFDVEIILEPAP
jgi:hypothetical protein